MIPLSVIVLGLVALWVWALMPTADRLFDQWED